MKCPKCGKAALMVEGLGEGKTRITCQDCRYQSVVDGKGRGLLVDTMPDRDPRKVLLG